MNLMDSVFNILFARYRRRIGDAGLESAWRKASTRISGLVVVSAVGLLILLLLAFEVASGDGIRISGNLKTLLQVAGGVAAVFAGIAFDRRFKKFLTNPPALQPKESSSETRLLRRFYVGSVGLFLAAIAFAMVL